MEQIDDLHKDTFVENMMSLITGESEGYRLTGISEHI